MGVSIQIAAVEWIQSLTSGWLIAISAVVSDFATRFPSTSSVAGLVGNCRTSKSTQSRRARCDRGKYRRNSSLRENCRYWISAKSRN
jgi:hypothetical protein